MDTAQRRAGLAWVMVGLVLQAVSVATGGPRPGPVTLTLVGLSVALAVTTIRRRGRAQRVFATATCVALALDFLGAVADRFGLFGAPGRPGVSWGNWEAFTVYTARLLPGLPHELVVAASVAATALEPALAVLLLSGRQRRWAARATAGLLTTYLAAMTLSLGGHAALEYALPVLIGAALLVSPSSVRTAHASPPEPGQAVRLQTTIRSSR